MSNSWWPHGLQHARLPWPSLFPRVCSDFMPIESIMPSNPLIFCCLLLLLPSIFLSITVFPVSQLFASGGQNTGVSASASVLPMSIQGWFPLGLTGLISLHSKGQSRVFSINTVLKHQFFSTQPSSWSNSHPYMTTRKTIALSIQTFVSKVMSLPLICCLDLA